MITTKKSLFTIIGQFLLLDIIMNLVQKTYQLLGPIIVSKGYAHCPMAIKDNPL